MKQFLLALRFLTVYPFGGDEDIQGSDLATSTIYYPLVGAMIGLILYWGLQWALIPWPAPLASAVMVTVWVLLTGGLHLDGLMDTFDGLGVRGDLTRRLEVMRDSRVGAFGVQAALLNTILKIAAVSALATHPQWFPALIFAPVAGRTAMVALMATGRYAREGYGLGREFVERTGKGHFLVATLLFVIIGYLTLGFVIFAVLLSQGMVFLLLRWFYRQNFGGITGDLLGAACEIHELAFLLFIPIIL